MKNTNRPVVLLVIAAIVTTMAGCDSDQRRKLDPIAALAPPALDLSTPDRALRSQWRAKDYLDSIYEFARRDPTNAIGKYDKVAEQVTRAALAGPALQDRSVDEAAAMKFDRQIVGVRMESQSRAVVTARVRNITPIPRGAIITERDAAIRRDGERYRYIFEKDSTGWRLQQIQSSSSYDGADTTWRDLFGAVPVTPTWTVP